MIGQTISHYNITEKLGEGGMGAVYRATDTRLGRDVALKILPEQFVQDRQRMARFQREAEVLASLNHPNISTIHGLEESDGVRALVLELVDGPTLAEQIAQGPIPVEEALGMALGIAQALEAAHEKGIIHRDLKPANVKVTPKGSVKVLDFGLAKATETSPSQGQLTQSPTLTLEATQAGVLLGTAAYMSPEQARGKVVDRKTDIFSFGLVLCEMLTGKGLYAGKSFTETIAAVIHQDPSLDELPADTPGRIRDLLARCLRKDPRRRLQHMGDARISLDECLKGTGVTVEEKLVPAQARPLWQRLAPWVVPPLLAVLAWSLKPAISLPDGQVTRMQIDIEPAERLGELPRFLRPIHTALALSPDGRNLVFSGVRGSQSQLYMRSLDQERAEAIPGTEGAQSPAFSPDGESILFWAGKVGSGEIKRVGLRGGPIMELYKFDTQPFGTSWLSDDMVVLGHPADRSESLAGIWRFSPQVPSGEILAAPEKDREEWKYFTPKVLPGGRQILFLIKRHLRWARGEQIVVRTLQTGEQKVLVENGTDPRYVPTGHLVYAQLGKLMAAPFDLDRLELTGPSVPVVEDLMHIHGRGVLGEGAAEYTFSRTGSLAYVRAGAGVERLAGSLVWVDRNGATERLQMPTSTTEGETGFLKWFRLSPDGSRVVGVDVDRDVAVLDLRRGTLTRLTLEGDNVHPSWSSDGNGILFSSRRQGDKHNLFYELRQRTGEVVWVR